MAQTCYGEFLIVSVDLWEFPDGTSVSTASVTRTFPTLGRRTVALTVTDPHAVRGTTSVDVMVANAAPTAKGTASPTTAHVGQQVSLSAAGSSDPEGDALSYPWEFPRRHVRDGGCHNPYLECDGHLRP